MSEEFEKKLKKATEKQEKVISSMKKNIEEDTRVMKALFKDKLDHFETYITNIQKDLEEEFIKRNWEKANLKLEMDRIYLKVNHILSTIGDADKGLDNIAQVVACLIENAQIQ